MFREILLPVDLADPDHQSTAIDKAVTLATTFGARLASGTRTSVMFMPKSTP